MFKENFIRLCNKLNKSPTAVCHDVGISSAAYAQWTENTIPRHTTLIKLADYFGVSPDELLKDQGIKEKPSDNGELDEIDNEIIKVFSSLSAEKKKAALEYLAFLSRQENGDN